MPDKRPIIIQHGSFVCAIYDVENLMALPLAKIRKLWKIMFSAECENTDTIHTICDWLPQTVTCAEAAISKEQTRLWQVAQYANALCSKVAAFGSIATKVLTGEVRLSYANLTAPRASQQGGEAKYSVTLLIPKSDSATYQNILMSIEAAAVETQSKLWNGIRPPVLPVPIHDGDSVRESGVPFNDECKGHWVITASSKSKPQVVHQSDINTELLPQDIYSGMCARVTINFFGYLNNGKKGIGCGLGNVMKTRDGEPLAGGASASSDFTEVSAPVYSAPQQPVYPQPPTYQQQPAYPQPQQPAYPQPQQPVYPQLQQTPAYGVAPVGVAPVGVAPVGVAPVGVAPINPLTGMPY